MSADDASITIKSGDTLSQRTVQYNREHGTNYTWQEVAEYNNLANPHLIHPGDVITFPAAPVQPEQPAPTVSVPSVPQPQAPKPSVPTPVYSAPSVSTGFSQSPSNYEIRTYVGRIQTDNSSYNTTINGIKTHNDKTGWARITAEFLDIVTFTSSQGLFTGIELNVSKIISFSGEIDLGSRNTMYSVDGTYQYDRVGFSFDFNILGNMGMGVQYDKIAPTVKGKGVVQNLWDSGWVTTDAWLSCCNVKGNNEYMKTSFSFKPLFLGGEIEVDVIEFMDAIETLKQLIKENKK